MTVPSLALELLKPRRPGNFPSSWCVPMRMRRATALLVLLVGLADFSLYATTVTATWSGTSGNWSNAANWSTNPTVPNNGGVNSYNAVINGTGSDTITFNATGTVINSLSLGTGETLQDNGLAPTLTIGDPSAPAAGSLTLAGTATVDWGSGSNLVLDVTAGNGGIANSGAINLSN